MDDSSAKCPRKSHLNGMRGQIVNCLELSFNFRKRQNGGQNSTSSSLGGRARVACGQTLLRARVFRPLFCFSLKLETNSRL